MEEFASSTSSAGTSLCIKLHNHTLLCLNVPASEQCTPLAENNGTTIAGPVGVVIAVIVVGVTVAVVVLCIW